MDWTGHCAILCVLLAVVVALAGAAPLGYGLALAASAGLLAAGWALWHREP